jgi:putative Mn2+ efflux pump MntP
MASNHAGKRDQLTFELIITAALLGAGLAMDAFSVSLADGLAERNMDKARMLLIAGTFAGFQFAMPLIGWMFVQFAESRLAWFEGIVPWIALALLLYIGGKMLKEGISENKSGAGTKESEGTQSTLGAGELIMQGIATSIDALSVGFTIASYALLQALASSVIIGVVTLAICLAGLAIGKKMGTVLSGKAAILGGVILIGIGVEIFVRGVIL